jgi:hypothetical protein
VAHSEGSAYKPLCGEIALGQRVGRMGSVSVDGPGHYNLDRSEDPWGKAATAACTVVDQRTAHPDFEPGVALQAAGYTKDGRKLRDAITT